MRRAQSAIVLALLLSPLPGCAGDGPKPTTFLSNSLEETRNRLDGLRGAGSRQQSPADQAAKQQEYQTGITRFLITSLLGAPQVARQVSY
jgi:hypothetical protein